jgi:serine protease Do
VGQTPGTGPTTAGRRYRPPAIFLIAALLVALVAGAAPASAADPQGPMTSRRLFDQARPGVQLITVRFSAGLVVPEAIITQANGRALDAIVAGRIRRGEIPATRAAASGAVVDELARNPFRWITASGTVHRTNVKLTASGSGFSVTPDGYIVTNAHVVAPRDDEIKAAFLAQDAREDRDDFIAGFREDGLSEAQATRFLNALVRWATRNARLANFKRTISVVGSTGSGSSATSKPRTAKLVAAGEEFPGKDVAVIKIRARNMAAVPLGDDGALSTGDRLFVLGFPGAATFNPVLSRASQQEPTLTQGVLSAKKQVNKGYTVLQTDAGMTHGNSGGPVLDEQGRVVGIATVGSVDPNTGREISGLNFAVPASIVGDMLRDAHVRASEGAAGLAYREALDDLDRQWYKRGLPLLERVKALDPGHPLVGKLIKDSQTAIRQGRDRTPREILGLPLAIAAGLAGAVVVAGIGTALLAVRSRRRRRRRAASPAPTPAFQPWGAPAPAAAAVPQSYDWWQDHQPQQPTAPFVPTAPAAPAPAAPAPALPVAEDGYGYSYGYGYGANGNGTAQTAEFPKPAEYPEPRAFRDREPRALRDREPRALSDPEPVAFSDPAPAESPFAEPAQPQAQRPAQSLVCWNCGRHNHPSLHYCEQCWTVLS